VFIAPCAIIDADFVLIIAPCVLLCYFEALHNLRGFPKAQLVMWPGHQLSRPSPKQQPQ